MSSDLQYSMCLMELCKHLEKYELQTKPSPTTDHSIYSNPISMKSLAYPYSCELQHYSKLAAEEVRHLPGNKLKQKQKCDSIRSVMQNLRMSLACSMNEACGQPQDYPTINKLQIMYDLASSIEKSDPSPVDSTQLPLKNILKSMGEENTLHSASQNFLYSSLLLEASQCWEAARNCNSKSTRTKRSYPTCSSAGQELNGTCQHVTKLTKQPKIDAGVSCQDLSFPCSSSISLVSSRDIMGANVSSACIKFPPSNESTFLLENDRKLEINELSNAQSRGITQNQHHGARPLDIAIATKTEEILKMYLCNRSNLCNDPHWDSGKEGVLTSGKSAFEDQEQNLDDSESKEQDKGLDDNIETSPSKIPRIPELIPFTAECLKSAPESWTVRCDAESAGDDQEDTSQSADGVLNAVPPLSMAGLLCRLNIGPEHSDGSSLEGSKDCMSSQLSVHPHCYICDIQFSSSLDLQHHILLHHTSRGAHGKVRD